MRVVQPLLLRIFASYKVKNPKKRFSSQEHFFILGEKRRVKVALNRPQATLSIMSKRRKVPEPTEFALSADATRHMLEYLTLSGVVVFSMASKAIRSLCRSVPFCQKMDTEDPYWLKRGRGQQLQRLRSVASLAQDALQCLDVSLKNPHMWELVSTNATRLRVLTIHTYAHRVRIPAMPLLEHVRVNEAIRAIGDIRLVPRLRSSSGVKWQGFSETFENCHMRAWSTVPTESISGYCDKADSRFQLSDVLCFPQLTTLRFNNEDFVLDCDTKDLPPLTTVCAPGDFFEQVLDTDDQSFMRRLRVMGLYSPMSFLHVPQLRTTQIHTIHLGFAPYTELVQCTPSVKRASVCDVTDLATVALWPLLHTLNVLGTEAEHLVVNSNLASLRCLRIVSNDLLTLTRHAADAESCLEYISLPESDSIDVPRFLADFRSVSYLSLCLTAFQEHKDAMHKTVLPNLRGLALHGGCDLMPACPSSLQRDLNLEELVHYCHKFGTCQRWCKHRHFTQDTDEFFSSSFHSKYDPQNFYHTHFQHLHP